MGQLDGQSEENRGDALHDLATALTQIQRFSDAFDTPGSCSLIEFIQIVSG
jgi:hypothetical protein